MTAAPEGAATMAVPPRLTREGIAALRLELAAVPLGGVAVLRAPQPGPFCAGLDFERAAAFTPEELREGLRAYGDLLIELWTAPVPTIAVVEGDTFGGGVGLAAACDLVLGTEQARMGLPEALYGFHPAMVFAVLDLRMPPQRSRLLALQCESIDAPAAQAAGLIDLVTPAASLDAVLARARRRLARARPDGVSAIKRHAPHRTRLEADLAAALEVTFAQLNRPDVRARLASAHP
jgi:methylglutaconyl-CoA hydratase/polyketide biosynthesis enoyl-CoA hydratase PksH